MYDVFISHASEDTEWCEQLAVRLRDEGIVVWFDKWQMQNAGIDLIEGMEEGLQKSRRALLILTPEYLRADKIWTTAERRYITHQNITGRNEFAIPLVLEDCKLPPFLEPLKFLDFRNPAAYEVNFQQIVSMLKGAAHDDDTRTLGFISNAVPQPGQLPRNSFLPYDWNPHFVGRHDELKKIHKMLNGDTNAAAGNNLVGKAAIMGLGGIGKTQLAIEYAFRFGRYYTGGVLWLNAASSEDFQASLASLAIPMGLNLPADVSAKIGAMRVLTELQRPDPRLLILDNVDDPTILSRCQQVEVDVGF